MKGSWFSFFVAVFLISNSYATDKNAKCSKFTLCPVAEGASQGQHRINFKYNYATHFTLYQFVIPSEWWSDEPLWGVQYELGLSEKSSVILNLGGGVRKRVERHAGGEEVTIERSVGFELWYKMVTSKGRGFLPSSAVTIGFPPGAIQIFLSNNFYFFKYTMGTELFPTYILVPLPASWFVGFSFDYKGMGMSIEYKESPWGMLTILQNEGGIVVAGLNFNLSRRLIIGLKYVKIFYDKESRKECHDVPTYTERLGADVSFSFELKKK